MNKTITLSSVGQNPENFTCILPETLKIPKNHEIGLLNLNLDTHTGTNHHYIQPDVGFKLHDVVLGGGARLHKQLNPPELMANGDYADFVQVNLNNQSQVFFYFKSNFGAATLSNPGVRYNATTKLPDANWSFQNNFDINTPTQTSGLLGPFGENETPVIGNANEIIYHTPYNGNINTWTHAVRTLNHHNTGYIEKLFIPNNQLPRAEFYISLDNLPIKNFISNNTFQGIVPSIYTHHNRFDSQADESIEPKHLIYHSLTNKNEIEINQIQVSIRDNITTDILHPSTFAFPSNLTIHIRQNEHFKNQDLQYFILNKIAHKK